MGITKDISKNDIKDAITELAKSGKTIFSKQELLEKLNRKRSNTDIDNIIEDLVKEGFINRIKQGKNNKEIQFMFIGEKKVDESLSEKAEDIESEPLDQIKALQSALDMVLGKYYERLIEDLKKIIFRDHVPTPVDLDRVYDFAKNSLGHASIKDLRIQLGLSLEEFMRYYREYILQNYELIPGGEEGFIKGGVMYGIIRRKR
ncbi:hypothetical protein [Sulfolobus sp. S-194]|uniref:hypothetical protein n=1 Tax=Sulfolobus sp. S-194 TaxID=2512240 RepID=UPI0025707636|nr:hypothetical protein [Sulfolobus sp. S-194]